MNDPEQHEKKAHGFTVSLFYQVKEIGIYPEKPNISTAKGSSTVTA